MRSQRRLLFLIAAMAVSLQSPSAGAFLAPHSSSRRKTIRPSIYCPRPIAAQEESNCVKRRKTILRGGGGNDASEPEQGVKAKFQFGGGDKREDPEITTDSSKAGDEGFFRGISKRLSGRQNANGQEVNRGSRDARNKALIREDSTPNPLDGVFEGVDEFRRRIRSIRTVEYLEEVIRSGVLLSAEEEGKRLSELDALLEANRLKLTQLEAARKQLSKEESKSREGKQREALIKTKELVEAKIERAEKQKELYQEQRQLILIASGKAKPRSNRRKGASSSTPSSQTKKSINGERKVKNVQSVPQSIFDRSKKNTTEIEEPPKEGGGGFSSSISSAQRFVSKIFDSAFQAREEWVVAFPKSRIDPGEVVPIHVAGIDLLVVATQDGKKVYAIANSCSHLGTPLETGMVERRRIDKSSSSASPPREVDCIVCPLHQTCFSMETGEVIGDWCPYPPVIGKVMGAVKTKNPVAVFDIRTRGKNIEIKLNSCIKDMVSKQEDDTKTKKTNQEQQSTRLETET